MFRARHSASQLLASLVGDCHNQEDDLDQPEFDFDCMADIYEVMMEDESLEDPDEVSPPEKIDLFRTLANRPCSSDECSICFCEFDDEVTELDCGHRFCTGCVGMHLQLSIFESPQLFHKRSLVRRDGTMITIKYQELIGIKCPHFSCLGVIEENRIRSLVNPEAYELFDQQALDQKLMLWVKKKELQPCPFACGNIVQEDCLCVNERCKKRQLQLRSRNMKKLLSLIDPADLHLERWAVSNPSLVRLCPTCSAQIEKNGGCDHMMCFRCHTSFLWSRAPLFKGSSSHWLAKARVEYNKIIATLPAGVILPEPLMALQITN